MAIPDSAEDERVRSFTMFLRGLSLPELETERANYRAGNSVRDTLLKHICDVTTENGGFPFTGCVKNIGSSWDGSKLHKVDEVDLLFVLSRSQIEVEESDSTIIVSWCNKVYKPRNIVEHFADSLEKVLAASQPEKLQHGGYAAPEFSGVRLCGPAVTVLYKARNEENGVKGDTVSVDITLAVPLSCLRCAGSLQSALKEWNKKKLSEVNEPFNCCLDLHAVPNTANDRWQLSSALFEAELLNILGSQSTVRKAYLLLKALLHRVDKKAVHENIFGINAIELKEGSTLLSDKLLANIHDKSLSRDQLNRCMRYGHTLLPKDKCVLHGELEKEHISINNAASKHILLAEADPCDFAQEHILLAEADPSDFAKDQNSKQVFHLMKQVVAKLVMPDFFVNHALQHHLTDHNLLSPEICKFSFRKFVVCNCEDLAIKLQCCYRMVLEYCLVDVSI